MMHIGFITSHFPFQNAASVGGIGTSIKNLADELVRTGNSVSVFVYGQNQDCTSVEDGISIYCIKNVKFKGLSWWLSRKKIQKVIESASRQNKIDIIEAPDWSGITSFIRLNSPIVIRLHGSDAYFCHLEDRPVKWANKYHEKRALVNASRIVSVSSFTATLTKRIFNLPTEITVIPNGVDVNKFIPGGDSGNKAQILYFGGIIRKKGVLEIPHIFNRVIEQFPDAHLTIIGKDMPDTITGSASTQSLMAGEFSPQAIKNVNFLGTIPYSEIRSHISAATVCIFPSFAEALPVSWLEAMALEKAIVTSNVGWSPEIIDNGIDGFMVDPKLHDSFADKILLLLKDEKLRTTIGRKAREKVLAKFSTEITARQTLKFYSDVIATSSASNLKNSVK